MPVRALHFRSVYRFGSTRSYRDEHFCMLSYWQPKFTLKKSINHSLTYTDYKQGKRSCTANNGSLCCSYRQLRICIYPFRAASSPKGSKFINNTFYTKPFIHCVQAIFPLLKAAPFGIEHSRQHKPIIFPVSPLEPFSIVENAWKCKQSCLYWAIHPEYFTEALWVKKFYGMWQLQIWKGRRFLVQPM